MDYKYMPFYIQENVNNYSFEMLSQEAGERKDLEYIRRMYPKEMNDLQKLIERECDRLEYEGSFMYDEYPDRVMLGIVTRRIVDKSSKECDMGDCNSDSRWFRGIVEVMLYNEIFRRRCLCRRKGTNQGNVYFKSDLGKRHF